MDIGEAIEFVSKFNKVGLLSSSIDNITNLSTNMKILCNSQDVDLAAFCCTNPVLYFEIIRVLWSSNTDILDNIEYLVVSECMEVYFSATVGTLVSTFMAASLHIVLAQWIDSVVLTSMLLSIVIPPLALQLDVCFLNIVYWYVVKVRKPRAEMPLSAYLGQFHDSAVKLYNTSIEVDDVIRR